MLRILSATARDLIPCAPEKLFDALLDVRGYDRWFPPEAKFELTGSEPVAKVGSVIRETLPGGASVMIRVIQIDRPILLVWDMFRGSFTGGARWTLTPMAQSTELACAVNLRLSPWTRVSSIYLDVEAEHGGILRTALRNLGSMLGGGHS
jgi:hypothetical protein